MNVNAATEKALEHISKAEVVELTRALIRIPSVNPPGGEGAVADHLAAVLSSEGIESELQEVEPGRPNLIASIGYGRGPHLIFNGHMDVVGAGERANWSVDPFAAEIRGNLIIGRGANDMKGGVAALTCALLAIHRAQIPLAGTLTYTAVMGEETGSEGTEFLLKSGFSGDGAIVGECSSAERIGIGYRGAAWFEVVTKGRTSHGSRPHLGNNAVLQMTELVIPAVQRVVKELPYDEHPAFLTKHATLNVGTISGGFKVNVVPDVCTATFDVRLVPGQSSGGLLAAVRRSLTELSSKNPDLEWDVNVIKEVDPFVTNETDPLVQSLVRACREVTSEAPDLIGKTGYSDANAFSRVGIPAVAFGPGEIGSGHCPDEWVDMDDLYRVARIYVSAAIEYCGVES